MDKKRLIAGLLAVESLIFASCNQNGNIELDDNPTVSETETILDPEPEEELTIIEVPKEEVDLASMTPEENANYSTIAELTLPKKVEGYKYPYAYVTNDTTAFIRLEADDIEVHKYQKVLVLESDEEYNTSYVELEDGRIGLMYNGDLEIMPGDYVEVDLGDQMLYLYKDNELIFTTPVITGKPATPTPEEYEYIRYKKTKTHLSGPTWYSYVEYWMPFDASQRGLHDASWQKHGFESDTYKTYGSHGCVNIPPENAKTIYDNVEKGTKVLIHK